MRSNLSITQNFLTDAILVKNLLAKTDISSEDTVIDIGAGKGIITRELCSIAGLVIAIELDSKLAHDLSQNIKSSNLQVLHADFLQATLPDTDYKVFSNIPFEGTSKIMRKLYMSGNSPTSAYLIMQKEAAAMYLGTPRETQRSLLLKPFFDVSVFHKFSRFDFYPVPAVDIQMIQIKKKTLPDVDPALITEYFDFVVFGTMQNKKTLRLNLSKVFTSEQHKRLSMNLQFDKEAKPLDLSYKQWVELFKYYTSHVDSSKKQFVKA